jgi:hypothetical protein
MRDQSFYVAGQISGPARVDIGGSITSRDDANKLLRTIEMLRDLHWPETQPGEIPDDMTPTPTVEQDKKP